MEYENFNAASARLTIHGHSVHPGSAKNVMRNAGSIFAQLHTLLPENMTPETTEGYEGFLHLTEVCGTVQQLTASYILRDHDLEKLEEKKKILMDVVAQINARYGEGTVEVDLRDGYRNMREKIEPHMHLIERARQAFLANGVQPRTIPIRGGTDGAMLSYMGLPCPNLSTGGFEMHGVNEFIPVRALETMPKVLQDLIYSFVEE